MQLHFARITHQTDQMIRVLMEKGINFDVCDMKDPTKLTSSVASSLRKSISKSVTASKSKSKVDGDAKEMRETPSYIIQEAKPSVDEWKSFKRNSVQVLCNMPITDINDLKAPLYFGLVRWG